MKKNENKTSPSVIRWERKRNIPKDIWERRIMPAMERMEGAGGGSSFFNDYIRSIRHNGITFYPNTALNGDIGAPCCFSLSKWKRCGNDYFDPSEYSDPQLELFVKATLMLVEYYCPGSSILPIDDSTWKEALELARGGVLPKELKKRPFNLKSVRFIPIITELRVVVRVEGEYPLKKLKGALKWAKIELLDIVDD